MTWQRLLAVPTGIVAAIVTSLLAGGAGMVSAQEPVQSMCVTVEGSAPQGGWDAASLADAIMTGSAVPVGVTFTGECRSDTNVPRDSQPSWWPRILKSERWTDPYVPPEEGLYYLTLLVEVGGAPGHDYVNPLQFTLRDQDGLEYESAFWTREPWLPNGDIKPGETWSGWLTFEIPTGQDWSLIRREYDEQTISVALPKQTNPNQDRAASKLPGVDLRFTGAWRKRVKSDMPTLTCSWTKSLKTKKESPTYVDFLSLELPGYREGDDEWSLKASESGVELALLDYDSWFSTVLDLFGDTPGGMKPGSFRGFEDGRIVVNVTMKENTIGPAAVRLKGTIRCPKP